MLSTEVIENKPLSGEEIIEIVANDVKAIMHRDGLFSPYVAYGRIAYTISVEFHLDNPMHPKHKVRVPRSNDPRIEGQPPLTEPSEDAVTMTAERDREITSPNLQRIQNDMPITVQNVVGGKIVNKELKYNKENMPEDVPPVDRNSDEEQHQEEWKKHEKFFRDHGHVPQGKHFLPEPKYRMGLRVKDEDEPKAKESK